MGLYEFLLIIIVLGMIIGFYLLERKEREKLNNRLMAKDFKEYKYFDKKFDKDIKEDEKIHDEARTEREEAGKVLRKEYQDQPKKHKTEQDVAEEIDEELDEAIEEPTKADKEEAIAMDKEFEDTK